MSKKELNLKQVYAEYLEHSYRYYVLDNPLVEDAYFDSLVATLLANWESFEHQHKHLTDISALYAGTGFHLHGKYPTRIQAICHMYPDTPFLEIIRTWNNPWM